MTEKKIKSAIPIYGAAVVWILYCVFFPLYRTWHFAVLACCGALAYVILSALFPGKTVRIEVSQEPVSSGDELVDALMAEGEKSIAEMRRLRESIRGDAVRAKLDEIISVTDKIFKKVLGNHEDYKQVKRFSEYFLPTTIKLLVTYDNFSRSGGDGGNITVTMERIESALDSILCSYTKFFDSLFERQAIDIETDIRVLETMLKNEGLLGSGFQQ